MGTFDNRRWVVINLSDYNDSELETLCLNSIESPSTLRKSLDNSKAILKWDGDTPSAFSSMTIYSHGQILEILKGSDWTESFE